MTVVIALIGTCLSANAAFFASYGTQERKRTVAEYRALTIADTIPGIAAPGIMTAFVILVAAKVFHGPLGADHMVSTIGGLAKVFDPVAGPIGSWIFALGYFAAAFSAMIANATAGGIMLSDVLGRGASANTRAARTVSGFILVWGITITALIGGKSPVQLIVLAQSLTVLTAPVLAFLLVYLSSKGTFMGALRNRWWHLALGICAFGVLTWFWIQLVMGFFS